MQHFNVYTCTGVQSIRRRAPGNRRWHTRSAGSSHIVLDLPSLYNSRKARIVSPYSIAVLSLNHTPWRYSRHRVGDPHTGIHQGPSSLGGPVRDERYSPSTQAHHSTTPYHIFTPTLHRPAPATYQPHIIHRHSSPFHAPASASTLPSTPSIPASIVTTPSPPVSIVTSTTSTKPC